MLVNSDIRDCSSNGTLKPNCWDVFEGRKGNFSLVSIFTIGKANLEGIVYCKPVYPWLSGSLQLVSSIKYCQLYDYIGTFYH